MVRGETCEYRYETYQGRKSTNEYKKILNFCNKPAEISLLMCGKPFIWYCRDHAITIRNALESYSKMGYRKKYGNGKLNPEEERILNDYIKGLDPE